LSNQNMRLVVIESPYAGDVEANVTYARAAMLDSIQQGEAPIASHLLYTQPGILDDADEGERYLGMKLGFEWGRSADLIAFYVDRGWSNGMLAALAHWSEEGFPYEIRELGGKTLDFRAGAEEAA
jgi:hypothetical protein